MSKTELMRSLKYIKGVKGGDIGHVCGIHQNHRSFSGSEVTEGFAFKDVLVIILRCEIATVKIGRGEMEPELFENPIG